MARALGLSLGVLIALAGVIFPSVSHAAIYPNASEAEAACEAKAANDNASQQSGAAHGLFCENNANYDTNVCIVYEVTDEHPGTHFGNFQYRCLLPEDQCKSRPNRSLAFGADETICVQGCMFSKMPDIGDTWTVHSGSKGVFTAVANGQMGPTGETCDSGPDQYPLPPPPPAEPDHNLCGGGSCYDPLKHKFCAVDGSGVQVCVPENTATGPGGCISSGDTTLCAGKPPPNPPNPPIVDPSSQIAGHDQYTHTPGDGTPGGQTIINNYNNSGSPPKSGATDNDVHPPGATPDPDAPKDPTSASGGGDCNSPPICEGAAATCAVVDQVYLLRCPPGGQQGGGDGGDDGDTTVPGLDGISETPGAGFMRVEDALSKLDTSGFGGGGQCPKFPAIKVDSIGLDYEGPPEGWCESLHAAGVMILLIAMFIALRILSEK